MTSMQAMETSAASTTLNFRLHPAVIMNFSEHLNRFKGRCNGDGSSSSRARIFGFLIGAQHERTVEVFNSVEVVVNPISGILERTILEKNQELNKILSPSFDILGWYCTGMQETDMQIHKALVDVNRRAFYLVLHPVEDFSIRDLPVAIFESALLPIAESSQLIFDRTHCSIEAVEINEWKTTSNVVALSSENGEDASSEFRTMLFETPSGFAMFGIAEQLFRNPERIWTWFAHSPDTEDVVSTLGFIKVEKKHAEWSNNIGLGKDLEQFIEEKYSNRRKPLVVPNIQLKYIIEKNMGLKCWFNSFTVRELTWGLNFVLDLFVIEEEKHHVFPLSIGLENKIKAYGFDVSPKTIDRGFINLVGDLYYLEYTSETCMIILHDKFDHLFAKDSVSEDNFPSTVESMLLCSKEIMPKDDKYDKQELLNFISIFLGVPNQKKITMARLKEYGMLVAWEGWNEIPSRTAAGSVSIYAKSNDRLHALSAAGSVSETSKSSDPLHDLCGQVTDFITEVFPPMALLLDAGKRGAFSRGIFEVRIHPAVVSNSLTHLHHVRGETTWCNHVRFGILLGVQHENTVEIINSVEVMIDPIKNLIPWARFCRRPNDVLADPREREILSKSIFNSLSSTFDSYKSLLPDMEFLGWYYVGTAVQDFHIGIHMEVIKHLSEKAIYVLLDPTEDLFIRKFPATIYEFGRKTNDGSPDLVRSCCSIEIVEAKEREPDSKLNALPGGKGKGANLKHQGFRMMLLETPSGFAMFHIPVQVLNYPQRIWTWFTSPYHPKNVISTVGFIKVENKAVVWDSDAGPGEELLEFIQKRLTDKTKELIVPDLQLKAVIEEKIRIYCCFIPCLVRELTWGLNYALDVLVPEEKGNCVFPLPLSRELEKKIRAYGFNISPHMIDREFINMLGYVSYLDISIETASMVLHKKFGYHFAGSNTDDEFLKSLSSQEMSRDDKKELEKLISVISSFPNEKKFALSRLKEMEIASFEDTEGWNQSTGQATDQATGQATDQATGQATDQATVQATHQGRSYVLTSVSADTDGILQIKGKRPVCAVSCAMSDTDETSKSWELTPAMSPATNQATWQVQATGQPIVTTGLLVVLGIVVTVVTSLRASTKVSAAP